MILELFLGFIVGSTLGILGGGGTMIGLPVLVYGLGVSTYNATLMSLIVVSAVSLLGTIRQMSCNKVVWQVAVIMSIVGCIVSPLVVYFSHFVDDRIRLCLFGIVMWLTSLSMWYNSNRIGDNLTHNCSIQIKPMLLICMGMISGAFAGFFAIGGGIITVPMLTHFLRLPYSKAVATALATMMVISIATVMNMHGYGDDFPYRIFVIFVLGALVGMMVSMCVSDKISEKLARRMFAIALLIMGSFVILKNTIFHFIVTR